MAKESITKRVTRLLQNKYWHAARIGILRESEARMSCVDAPRLARSLVRIGRKAKLTDDEILKSSCTQPIERKA
jgi:hypothetical protein